MPTFQYISDIHLEDKKDKVIPLLIPKMSADYLILAGDIGRIDKQYHLGRLQDYLRACTSKWKAVIYVPGNHEYYKVTIEEGNRILQRICDETGVIFLNNTICKLDDITIVGTTLWSMIIDEGVAYQINDFTYIKDNHVYDHNRRHMEALQFLQETLKEKKCLVITHHLPTMKLAGPRRSKGGSYDLSLISAYGTDILDKIPRENIVAWIYGHTHNNLQEIVEGVKFYTNQRGYKTETLGEYDLNKILTL
jgi:predicted phosphodiesterase